jgi:hypothetical protein
MKKFLCRLHRRYCKYAEITLSSIGKPFVSPINSSTVKTSMKTALAAIALLMVFSCKKENINRQLQIHDYDATNVVAGKYGHVKIGTQVWMTKNLDVTHYRTAIRYPR